VADDDFPTRLSPGSSFRSVYNFPTDLPLSALGARGPSFHPPPQPMREPQVLPFRLVHGLTDVRSVEPAVTDRDRRGDCLRTV
jgi:hypothetical protein